MIRLVDVYTQPDALEILYELLKERPAEAAISHHAMPTFEQHRQFVTRRPYEAWYLLLGEGDAVLGSIYLTKAREVGIFIFQAHQRRGYAQKAIAMLREKHPGRLLANVAPLNLPSIAFFEDKLGGRVVQITYELKEE